MRKLINLGLRPAIGILTGIPFLAFAGLVACAGPTNAVSPSEARPTHEILPAGTPPSGNSAGVTDQVGMPELSPYVPSGWSAPIVFNRQSLSFEIAWTNQGDAMAEEYSIVLLLDGKQIAEWYKPVTAPGSVKTQSLELVSLPDPGSFTNGLHSLELIVDPGNLVAESDEGNNSFSVSQYIRFDLPDLVPHVPSSQSWDKPVVIGGADVVHGTDPPPPDGGYFIAYSIANAGDGTAKSWGALTQLSINGLNVSTCCMPGVSEPSMREIFQRRSYIDQIGNPEPLPGASLISIVPIWKISLMEGSLTPGIQQVEWIIDESDSVLESNEENNAMSLTVILPASRERTTVDQPDQGGNLIHLVYALPADANDENWDVNGTIESLTASMQSWLRERAPVQGLRFDSDNGVLDITFLRLDYTLSQFAQAEVTSALLMDGMLAAGLNDPGKIYAVWFPYPGTAGGLSSVCGAQTFRDGVRFSFTYFERNDDPEPNLCVNQHTIMLHEIFHALNAVSPCAPNYLMQSPGLNKGHVIDDSNDLMYGGDELGVMIELDKDRDDYFGHGMADCPDVADSPFFR